MPSKENLSRYSLPAKPEYDQERAETPSDLGYRHIGAFKLGSLRITNGSPSPSVKPDNVRGEPRIVSTTIEQYLPGASQELASPFSFEESPVSQSAVEDQDLYRVPSFAEVIPRERDSLVKADSGYCSLRSRSSVSEALRYHHSSLPYTPRPRMPTGRHSMPALATHSPDISRKIQRQEPPRPEVIVQGSVMDYANIPPVSREEEANLEERTKRFPTLAHTYKSVHRTNSKETLATIFSMASAEQAAESRFDRPLPSIPSGFRTSFDPSKLKGHIALQCLGERNPERRPSLGKKLPPLPKKPDPWEKQRKIWSERRRSADQCLKRSHEFRSERQPRAQPSFDSTVEPYSAHPRQSFDVSHRSWAPPLAHSQSHADLSNPLILDRYSSVHGSYGLGSVGLRNGESSVDLLWGVDLSDIPVLDVRKD
jgi:hypothetical protein